jgi:hypothetical protein
MPLRDHFHPSMRRYRSWSEIHGMWPAAMVMDLKPKLPPGFQAGPKANLGSPYEVDISTHELDSRDSDLDIDPSGGGTATVAIASPTLTVEAELTEQDEYSVRIYDVDSGRTLVAAIEIVSPSNKDRPSSRDLFISKVTALLEQGVCVSVVDLVTEKQFNLYTELLESLGRNDPKLAPVPPSIYAVTLRARRTLTKTKPRVSRGLLDAWFYPMTIGQPLPTLPIWLTSELRVLLNLEVSYEETCKVLDIPPEPAR